MSINFEIPYAIKLTFFILPTCILPLTLPSIQTLTGFREMPRKIGTRKTLACGNAVRSFNLHLEP